MAGTPVNRNNPVYDAGDGWLGAANLALGHIDEFHDQIRKIEKAEAKANAS